jgi:hypothetical protein
MGFLHFWDDRAGMVGLVIIDHTQHPRKYTLRAVWWFYIALDWDQNMKLKTYGT